MYKRRDWLHLHGEDGGDSDSSADDSSDDEAAVNRGAAAAAGGRLCCPHRSCRLCKLRAQLVPDPSAEIHVKRPAFLSHVKRRFRC